jgi:hypothetical protein
MRKLPNDLSSATTVGLDLAKHVFFIHAEDAQGQVVFARKFGAATFSASSPLCRRAWSVWKRAVRRIIGGVNSWHWGTMSA